MKNNNTKGCYKLPCLLNRDVSSIGKRVCCGHANIHSEFRIHRWRGVGAVNNGLRVIRMYSILFEDNGALTS